MGSESSMNFQKGDMVKLRPSGLNGYRIERVQCDGYCVLSFRGVEQVGLFSPSELELVYRPGFELGYMELFTAHGAIPLSDVRNILDVMYEEGCPSGEHNNRAAWLKSKFNCARQSDARDRMHWKERYGLATRLDEANQEIDKLKRDLADCAQRDAKSKALETQLALALQKAKYSDDAANEAVREMKLAREERQQARRMRDALGEVMGEFGFPWWAPNMQDITKAAEWLRERLVQAQVAGIGKTEIQRLKDQLELARLERDEARDEARGVVTPAGKDIDGTPLFVGDTVVGVNCDGEGCGGRNGDFHTISRARGSVGGIPVLYMTDTTVGLANRFRKQSK